MTRYRVVYGETMPAWEKVFSTRLEADAFARKQKRCGDIIFSVGRVVPGEEPTLLSAGKTCNRCGKHKPRSEFLKDKTGRDGLRASCRACDAAARKAKRPTRKELASALRLTVGTLAAENRNHPLLPELRDFLKRI